MSDIPRFTLYCKLNDYILFHIGVRWALRMRLVFDRAWCFVWHSIKNMWAQNVIKITALISQKKRWTFSFWFIEKFIRKEEYLLIIIIRFKKNNKIQRLLCSCVTMSDVSLDVELSLKKRRVRPTLLTTHDTADNGRPSERRSRQASARLVEDVTAFARFWSNQM